MRLGQFVPDQRLAHGETEPVVLLIREHIASGRQQPRSGQAEQRRWTDAQVPAERAEQVSAMGDRVQPAEFGVITA